MKQQLQTVLFSHYSDKFKINRQFAPDRSAIALRIVLNSIRNLGDILSGGILYHDDGFPHEHYDGERWKSRIRYANEVERVASDYGMRFVSAGQRSGYRAAYLKAMPLVEAPFIFHLEHDWKFTSPFPHLERVLRIFDENASVNYAKFANYHDELERFGSTLVRPQPWVFKFDKWRSSDGLLMPDTVLSTNPSICRTSAVRHWCDLIRGNDIGPACSGNGFACGIEEVLSRGYFLDIASLGFDAAHKKWGVYLILNNGTNRAFSEHIGI